MARPKKEIDEDQVLKLAQIMCTQREIAAFFDVDIATINRRFSSLIHKGHEYGKMSLRRCQMKNALNGHATMQIWLGKQYLDQSDHKEIDLVNADGHFKAIADAIAKSDTNTDPVLLRSAPLHN